MKSNYTFTAVENNNYNLTDYDINSGLTEILSHVFQHVWVFRKPQFCIHRPSPLLSAIC